MRAEIEKIVGERLRGNPDGSLSAAGTARAPALFPAIGSALLRIDSSSRRIGVAENKVMAGGTPANPAAMESIS
jgi:hypothetical protein